jgi:hypothetical protein
MIKLFIFKSSLFVFETSLTGDWAERVNGRMWRVAGVL